jgi:hypothetical protein
MGKKGRRIRKNAVDLPEERVRLVHEGKPEDIRFAANVASGVRPASERGTNGLEPVGKAIWRIVNDLRRGHYVKPTTEDDR